MDDIHQSVFKTLVDNVSSRLNDISDKLSRYEPILERIGNQSDENIGEITNILNELKSITKTLDTTVKDFYDRTDKFNVGIKEIKEKVDNINLAISSTNDHLKKGMDEIKEKISETSQDVKPVGKVLNFLSKPMGLLIFIIGLIVASFTIVNVVHNFLEYAKNTKTSIQSISK